MLFLERFLALFIALGLFYPLAGSDWDLVSIDDEQVSIATENTEFIDSDPFRFIDFIATLSLYEILFYTVIFILPSVMTLLDKKIKRWHIIYFTVKFINVLGLFSLIGLTVFIIGANSVCAVHSARRASSRRTAARSGASRSGRAPRHNLPTRRVVYRPAKTHQLYSCRRERHG